MYHVDGVFIVESPYGVLQLLIGAEEKDVRSAEISELLVGVVRIFYFMYECCEIFQIIRGMYLLEVFIGDDSGYDTLWKLYGC